MEHMIQDENWTRKQVIDLWFDSSQEQVASTLGISLGKVNSIIQEFTKSHEWASKVRELVISAKKNGVDINQIISNDRFVNAVKKYGSDYDKLEVILAGLSQIISQNDGDPAIAVPIIYQILEIVYKLHKSPIEILEELQSFTNKRRTLEDQIQAIETELKNNGVTIGDIQICTLFMDNLENFEVSDMAQANNILNNIREQGGDVLKVLKLLSSDFSIKCELNKFRERIFDNINTLEKLKAESQVRRESVEISTRIAKRGYTQEAITNVLNVIEHVMREYENAPNGLFFAQLREDLSVYGSLSACNIALKYQNRRAEFQITWPHVNCKFIAAANSCKLSTEDGASGFHNDIVSKDGFRNTISDLSYKLYYNWFEPSSL